MRLRQELPTPTPVTLVVAEVMGRRETPAPRDGARVERAARAPLLQHPLPISALLAECNRMMELWYRASILGPTVYLRAMFLGQGRATLGPCLKLITVASFVGRVFP